MPRRKPEGQLIDGVAADPHLDPDLFREALKFRAKRGDIVQLSYPKSGTHWAIYIMQLILKRGEPVRSYEEFVADMRYLGIVDFKRWAPNLPVRIFQTHQVPQKETMTEEGKYVYLARNPWDVCVSLFHMTTNLLGYRFEEGTFDDFFESFIEGDCGVTGSYFNHVALGYALRNEPNVFFITYEELLADTRGTVLRLARFLGENYARELEQDVGLLEKLLERCTADSMRPVLVMDLNGRSSQEEWDDAMHRVDISCKEGDTGDNKKYCPIREGKVGGWKKYFSTEQLWRLEAKIREEEKNSAFMDLWKGVREEALADSMKD
ncbi:sulfotransferase 2A8-like [Haemaphysalis longicornis]